MNLKKITPILRKLGIFRSGSVSWKGDAKNRPIEMISDSIYNKEKDTINKKDIKNIKNAFKKDSENNSKKSSNLLLYIAISIGCLFLLLFILSASFGFWFFVNIAIWAGFVFYYKKQQKEGKYNQKQMILFLIAIIIISFFSLSAIDTKKPLKEEIKYNTSQNPLDLVELSIQLEEDLLLEDVLVSETENKILEIRTKTPKETSKNAIYAACSYIFNYTRSHISEDIKSIRIILTVNYLDALIIEADAEKIDEWINGKINDEEFIKTFKEKNLIK